MPDRFDRVTARFLTLRYAIALAIVAVLTVTAQVVVQAALHRQAHDAAVVNLAGRQRMLSQRLSKAALAWREVENPERRRDYRAEVERVLEEWTTAQTRLSAGAGEPGMGADNSAAVAAEFTAVQPTFARMVAAARALDADQSAVDTILASEPNFLHHMETIVALYQREATTRVQRLVVLEYVLCGVLLVVLVIEALWVFRPAVRRLRVAIADRERLRDQELATSELAVAAEVARNIGQDLHDGLGQTLTALSFQTKSLERQLAGHPAQANVALVGAGVADAIAQTRAAARRLCPVDIQVAGLEAALRELADATALVAGVTCRVECDHLPTFPGGEDLFRIAQEALTNALRHGKAQTIDIAVRCTDRAGILSIRDDGHGGTVPAQDGIGMRSMRHRCQRLGGQLELGPLPGRGWQVVCHFPLAPSAQANQGAA